MVSGAFLSLTKITSSIGILIVCKSCKMSCNVLSHSHWGLHQFFAGGSLKFRGGSKKKTVSRFRSPEVGISAISITMLTFLVKKSAMKNSGVSIF